MHKPDMEPTTRTLPACVPRFWDTTYLNEFTPPDGTIETLKEPIHDGWLELENEDRQKVAFLESEFLPSLMSLCMLGKRS